MRALGCVLVHRSCAVSLLPLIEGDGVLDFAVFAAGQRFGEVAGEVVKQLVVVFDLSSRNWRSCSDSRRTVAWVCSLASIQS